MTYTPLSRTYDWSAVTNYGDVTHTIVINGTLPAGDLRTTTLKFQVTFLNPCKTNVLTPTNPLASVDLDYIISDPTATTSALNTFAAGPDACPLQYELYFDATNVAIGTASTLYSMNTYEAVPTTYPIFKVGTSTDNTLSTSGTRVGIKILVKSKYFPTSTSSITFNVLFKSQCYLVTPTLKAGWTFSVTY